MTRTTTETRTAEDIVLQIRAIEGAAFGMNVPLNAGQLGRIAQLEAELAKLTEDPNWTPRHCEGCGVAEAYDGEHVVDIAGHVACHECWNALVRSRRTHNPHLVDCQCETCRNRKRWVGWNHRPRRHGSY